MSNLPVLLKNIDLALYGDTLKENENLSSGMFNSVPSIRLEGKMYVVFENGVKTLSVPSFIGVIIASGTLSKKYFAQPYTGKEQSAPDCFSINGEKPSQSSKNPQNTLCSKCPHNVWGLDNSRKRCSDFRRIIICILDDKSPTKYILYRLDVPPASLKNLFVYGNLLSKHNVKASAMMTKFSFDADETYPKIEFEPSELVPLSVYNTIIKTAKNDPLVAKTLGSEEILHQDSCVIPTGVIEETEKVTIASNQIPSISASFDMELDKVINE